jgi:hypothetical protein
MYYEIIVVLLVFFSIVVAYSSCKLLLIQIEKVRQLLVWWYRTHWYVESQRPPYLGLLPPCVTDQRHQLYGDECFYPIKSYRRHWCPHLQVGSYYYEFVVVDDGQSYPILLGVQVFS